MRPQRHKFNPKRRGLEASPDPERLKTLAAAVRYSGNPEHKRNPGDFGLTPPFGPRPGKTLCDAAGILQRLEALRLLREGVRRGLISDRGGAFPQNIWAVSPQGIPLEAQLEGDGAYHGYPMPALDPFRERVLDRWALSQ